MDIHQYMNAKKFLLQDEHFTTNLIVSLKEQEKSTQHGVMSMIFISTSY